MRWSTFDTVMLCVCLTLFALLAAIVASVLADARHCHEDMVCPAGYEPVLNNRCECVLLATPKSCP